MHKFMKNLDEEMALLATDELTETYSYKKTKPAGRKFKACVSVVVLMLISCSVFLLKNIKISNIDTAEKISLSNAPIAATASKKDIISIPSGVVKANPFVPYRTIKDDVGTGLVNDVPQFDLVAPPTGVNENSDAAKILDTVVSGILYDKFSPSAILSIDGNDYLVKKGDTINNYKVIAIAQDSVTVKLGNNTYKAGIGELLTEGGVNYNDVSNLSKKFGGEQR